LRANHPGRMSILIVVQARVGSTRLPGKVLLPLAGKPLLQQQLERVRAATSRFQLIVATTTDVADDAIEVLCDGLDVPLWRGHPTDLLDRHYQAARAFRSDAVVKIPSDCPLIDPAVVDQVLTEWTASEGKLDFLSNLHPPTWPDGNDVEVMSWKALDQAFSEARKPHEREHTTPFIWDLPERFRIGNVRWDRGLDFSMTHRLTVDYPDDYRMAAAVYEQLGADGRVFSLDEILALFERRPDIFAINSAYAGINWYRHHLDSLRTVTSAETRFAPGERGTNGSA